MDNHLDKERVKLWREVYVAVISTSRNPLDATFSTMKATKIADCAVESFDHLFKQEK